MVLLLDEPFEGVDPAGARRMEGLFQALIARGRTILFSVHDLELVARLGPSILLLDRDGSLGGRQLDELRWQDFEGDESALEVPPWLGSSSF